MIIDATLITAAYLLGSISSAIIVCHLLGLPDPRGQGSGNPGATNVLRIGGKKPAAITLIGDMFKGLIPVLVGHLLEVSLLVLTLTGLAAFLGHLYPVFFHFKGGKGVATLLGVLLGINWMLGLSAIATWLFVAKVLKISSLSALIMAALVPFYSWFFHHNWALTLTLAGMSAILFWRHRSNIQKLLSGQEDRISGSNESADIQTDTLKDLDGR